MFTGIIKARGSIADRTSAGGSSRLVVESEAIAGFGLAAGDSVAVNGVCLTALEPAAASFAADVSSETLACTTLGRLGPGDPVNLEPALKAGEPFGGHLVAGHVDGLAELVEAAGESGGNRRMRFEAPGPLARYIAPKGSVTLDGVSLTVNRVEGTRFELNLIPHTLEVTTLGQLAPGDRVNLEVDLVARYLERLLETRNG